MPEYFRNEVDAESAAHDAERPKDPVKSEPALTPIEGSAISVKSGDSITVSANDGTQYDVRLSGVDAPEDGQEQGSQARDALAAMILNKTVRIVPLKADESGSMVGKVFADGKQINLELIKTGLAWHHRFSKFQSEDDRAIYEAAQLSAKAAGIGIWSRPDPVAPWDFRAGETSSTVDEATAVDVPPAGSADTPAAATEQNSPRRQTFAATGRTASHGAKAPIIPTVTVADVPVVSERPSVQPAQVKAEPVSTQQPAPANAKPAAAKAQVSGDGRTYTLGPRGGCYYISAGGSKSYVDKSRCGQ